MPSSKGKPTDPKLREELKDKVKNQPNSDGGGKGQWSAWKASKLSKEYEAHGGGYENQPGSKNEPKKGAPEPKDENKKRQEVNEAHDGDDVEQKSSDSGADAAEKPKANTSKKTRNKDPKPKTKTPSKKERKEPTPGSRKSARVSAKRDAETAGVTNSNGSKKKKSS